MKTAIDNLIPMERLEKAAAVLRLLAHPHRLRICELLMSRRIAVSEIAEILDLPSNFVSQHLSMMRAYGLVCSEREGKTVYYRVCSPQPGWLLECIRNHEASDE